MSCKAQKRRLLITTLHATNTKSCMQLKILNVERNVIHTLDKSAKLDYNLVCRKFVSGLAFIKAPGLGNFLPKDFDNERYC